MYISIARFRQFMASVGEMQQYLDTWRVLSAIIQWVNINKTTNYSKISKICPHIHLLTEQKSSERSQITLSLRQKLVKRALRVSFSSHVIDNGNESVTVTLRICFFEGVSSIYEVSRSVVFALHLEVKPSSLGERISRSWKGKRTTRQGTAKEGQW